MLKTHSPISKRAHHTWPDAKHLALHFSLNVEHFEFGQMHSAARQDTTHAYALPFRGLRPNGSAVRFNNGAAD